MEGKVFICRILLFLFAVGYSLFGIFDESGYWHSMKVNDFCLRIFLG